MISILKSIFSGKTLLRTLMNKRCESVSLLNKKVLDLGSGEKEGSYHQYFKDKAETIVTSDMKIGGENHKSLNFETDDLPFNDQEFDVVLSFNLFEHIFNYQKLINETYRILKKDGELIGFVPFLVNFHPDPNDYFRYTEQALNKIFQNANFSEIKIETIGNGPFSVNYNNIVLSVPKIIRVIILPFYLILDILFLKLRPNARKRYPLGYFFIVRK